MSKITYADKTSGRVNTTPNDKKVTADDMNEIKTSVNALYDGGLSIDISLSEAEIKDLHNTSILAIPAQGANTIIDVIRTQSFYTFNTTPYSSSLISMRPVGSSSSTFASTTTIDQSEDWVGVNNSTLPSSLTDRNNVGIELFANSALTGGDGSVIIRLFYTISLIP